MLEMAELVLQDVALKVSELQVRFDAFEADNRMSDCIITEIEMTSCVFFYFLKVF